MEREGSFLFHERNYLQSSFSAFLEMRIKMHFTDVVIKVRDRDFRAHLVILAARIPYFQKFCQPQDGKIEMNEIDPDCMEALINFAYEGKLKITAANVHQVFFAAVYLQLSQIQEICHSFLTNKFSSNSEPVISPFLRVIPSDEYIHQNFDQFSSTKEFLFLPYFAVKEIFGRDNLKVTSEEKVFEALMKWISLSVAKRRNCLPHLLSEIRMNFLSPEYLVEKVAAEHLIRMSDQCEHIVEEAKNYHLLKKRLMSHSFNTKPRSYTEAFTTVTTYESGSYSDSSSTVKENQSNVQTASVVTTNKNVVGDGDSVNVSSRNQIMAPGVATTSITTSQNVLSPAMDVSTSCSMNTNGNVSNEIKHGIYSLTSFTSVGTFVGYYNCKNGKWDNFPQNSQHDGVQHVAHLKDKLYVFFPMVIETFNLITHEWAALGPVGMIKGAGIASYGSIIYIFGGLDSRSIIQMFDVEQNKWIGNEDMKYPCHNMSVISARKCIYLTGGYSSSCCSTFLKFHPITKLWADLKQMNCPRMDHDSAVLNEKIYVCGGRNRNCNFLNSMEVYDKSLNLWNFVQCPKATRHSLSLVSWGKKLYVFGGTTEKENCCSAVEIYDTETKLWSLGASVPSRGTRVAQGVPSHSLPLPLPNQENPPTVIRGIVAEPEE